MRCCSRYCMSRSDYDNVWGTAGSDLLRQCLAYLWSRSVTVMFGVLRKPVCCGIVGGIAVADMLWQRLVCFRIVCYGNVWGITAGAEPQRQCLGLFLCTLSDSSDAERCFLFLVLGITARRPQRFRQMHGLRRTIAQIATSPFLLPASLALLLPVIPPRRLLLSGLQAHTALHSTSDGTAPSVPSGCRSRARYPKGGGRGPSRSMPARARDESSSSVPNRTLASSMPSTASRSWRGQVHS